MKTKTATSSLIVLPVKKISPNPDQPRTEWDLSKDKEGKTTIQRLAQSIKEQGLLQPIIVTPRNGHYMIVCGERRYRAIKSHTRIKEIPCIVRKNMSETDVIETAVTENMQREDLSPVDEAKAFKLLMDKCKYTQKKLAQKFGLSVASINYKLSLLKLSPDIQEDIKNGNLSETEGRTIAQAVNKIPDAKKKKAAMKEIRSKVKKAQKANGKNIKTKEVATIAKTVVEKKKPAKKGKATKAKAEKPKPPTAKEKTDAKAFAKAVTQASKLFSKFNGNSKKGVKTRLRFAYVLLETQKDTANTVAKLQKFFSDLIEEIAEVKRQRMVAKLK